MNEESEEGYTPSPAKIYFIGFFCIFLAILSIFIYHYFFGGNN